MRIGIHSNFEPSSGEAGMNNCLETSQSLADTTLGRVDSRCRLCGASLPSPFLDLGQQPLCESILRQDQLNEMEPFFPLVVYVCNKCMLVQLDQYVSPDHIFTEYAYFSSYSDSWLKHSKAYARMATDRFGLGPNSLAIELASNDGYLLQYFSEHGVPVLGIEPAANVAKAASEKGVPTLVKFFGVRTAEEQLANGTAADLLIGNNVLAQVPDLHDFVEGMRIILKLHGRITMEFPHLMRLLESNQFDTIYHEHFSYFSLAVVEKLFFEHGLKIFDVEELPTHGGSLRIYGCHQSDSEEPSRRLEDLRKREIDFGLDRLQCYASFAERVKETKWKLLEFLITAKRQGRQIAGYGAPGKGNTLLNYCGIRTDFVDYVVDRNPYKQGKFLPGTHIPIFHPDRLKETRPDLVLILPWNVKAEIISQISYIREWGGKFIVPIPEVQTS